MFLWHYNTSSVSSVYRTLRIDLNLTTYRVTVLQHLKETDINRCLDSSITSALSTFFFGYISINGCKKYNRHQQMSLNCQLSMKSKRSVVTCAKLSLQTSWSMWRWCDVIKDVIFNTCCKPTLCKVIYIFNTFEKMSISFTFMKMVGI